MNRCRVWLAACGLCLSFWGMATAGATVGASSDAAERVVTAYEATRRAHQRSDIYVLDRHGALLGRVRRDFQVRRGDWLPLSSVSPAVVRAVIQSEDRRFFEHHGVDWLAVAGAAWGSVLGGRGRGGASTLSMQLAALLDPALGRPGQRDIMDKFAQARRAQAIEKTWTKQQILEAYLNLVPFRGELAGIDAVSRILFQKHASGLNAREGALAAALLRGPNAPLPVLVQRSCRVLTQMGRAKECSGLASFVARRLEHTASAWPGRGGRAPHFSRLAVDQARVPADQIDVSVRTTLDSQLQDVVVSSARRHLQDLLAANIHDAAVVVLENSTGDVLAYLGSSGDLSQAQFVDHARSLRQAGSALKPFLYAQALQEQRLTAASLLDNGPLNLPTASGLYVPQNYDRQFSGWVSARTALASSLNIPAVRVLKMVGPATFVRTLIRLGLPLNRTADFYGYSLALGSADVSLFTLTNAYRALANGGCYSGIRMLAATPAPHDCSTSQTGAEQVFDPGAAWIVGDILADRQARARTFGLDSPLSTSFWSAVKTGTSKDMRDNWTIGWTARYTVGVWVGNSGGASMQDVSGVSGAGPIWHDVVQYLHSRRLSIQPAAPPAINRLQISFQDDLEPSREEAFIGDTGMRTVHLGRNANASGPDGLVLPRILSPASGTRVALDPDIPLQHQRMLLQAAGLPQDAVHYVWSLDGKELGRGERVWWTPRPGQHLIRLEGPDGEIGRAIIDVRGVM